MSDYWKIAIEEALEEANLVASLDQISMIAKSIEYAHENYAEFSGKSVADSNFVSDAEIELARLNKVTQDRERFLLSTKPCRCCYTAGVVTDGWGRDVVCPECRGVGRVAIT